VVVWPSARAGPGGFVEHVAVGAEDPWVGDDDLPLRPHAPRGAERPVQVHRRGVAHHDLTGRAPTIRPIRSPARDGACHQSWSFHEVIRS